MEENLILEVTTFHCTDTVSPLDFAKRDAQVEHDFTSQQPGFIRRQSAVDTEGNYVVLVFWRTPEDADASMAKFMGDTSVADYASMIDASSMKMSRFHMDTPFKGTNSGFVEIMSFNVKAEVDKVKFDSLNQRVETEFTGKRKGFVQRLTGADDKGRQVVAIYWENKALSDASLQPFMEASVAIEFMQSMDQSTVSMGRYSILNQD